MGIDLNVTMMLELLLTPEIRSKMPDNVEIRQDYGEVTAVFEEEDGPKFYTGDHVIIKTNRRTIIEWLGQFDFFVRGDGIPMFQEFRICHVDEKFLRAVRED